MIDPYNRYRAIDRVGFLVFVIRPFVGCAASGPALWEIICTGVVGGHLVVHLISIPNPDTRYPIPDPRTPRYFTSVESLKIGRMMAMAMKPTTEPMMMIMTGSIMLVTSLMTSRSCFE